MATQEVSEDSGSSRMANVRYAIRDLAVVADEVAREGHQILFLNIGDPCKFDFATPPHMIEAVHKAMLDGHNSYGDSLGIRPAVMAIGTAMPSARLQRYSEHLRRIRQRGSDRQLPHGAGQSWRQRADPQP